MPFFNQYALQTVDTGKMRVGHHAQPLHQKTFINYPVVQIIYY